MKMCFDIILYACVGSCSASSGVISGVTAYTYVKMREAKRAHLPNSIRLNT